MQLQCHFPFPLHSVLIMGFFSTLECSLSWALKPFGYQTHFGIAECLRSGRLWVQILLLVGLSLLVPFYDTQWPYSNRGNHTGASVKRLVLTVLLVAMGSSRFGMRMSPWLDKQGLLLSYSNHENHT